MRLSKHNLYVVTFHNQDEKRTDVKGDLYTSKTEADADAERFTQEDAGAPYFTMTLASYIGTVQCETHNATLRTIAAQSRDWNCYDRRKQRISD